MKIYLAGNFPQMSSVEKELKVMKWASKKNDFPRLVSFFYAYPNDKTDWTGNVIKAAFRHAILTRWGQ